jgi:chromosome segregation ATPase
MNDSADIKSAETALKDSLDSLEAGLADLLSRMQSLETRSQDSEAFREDRVKLAGQLDEMAAQAETAKNRLAEREAQFSKLTQESEAELDRVMAIVRGALEKRAGA